MRPISYSLEYCEEGPRIGGAIPEGQEDQLVDEHTQYFGTFPILDALNQEFSVFHRFDIKGIDEDRDVISHNNRILRPSDLIWALVHQRSRRGTKDTHCLEPRSITLAEPKQDEFTTDDGQLVPFPESKLGGKCYLERRWLQSEVTTLEDAGYNQLLQIGLHCSDLIEGFPWDPGYLHVWALNPSDQSTYRFMVEQ